MDSPLRSRSISIERKSAKVLGVSKAYAYKIIRDLNGELDALCYLTVSGKVPRAFWEKKFYGYQDVAQMA